MQIQVNTDKTIQGGERLTQFVTAAIDAKLHRFGGQITRVEVHLSDENGHKSHGNDKKCVLEARPAGLPPVAVTHLSATLDQALHGAVEKLERLLGNTFDHLHHPKGTTTPDIV